MNQGPGASFLVTEVTLTKHQSINAVRQKCPQVLRPSSTERVIFFSSQETAPKDTTNVQRQQSDNPKAAPSTERVIFFSKEAASKHQTPRPRG